MRDILILFGIILSPLAIILVVCGIVKFAFYIGGRKMSKVDYDKKKFWMDEYGNLYPKKKIKGVTADEVYGKEKKDERDSTNVSRDTKA